LEPRYSMSERLVLDVVLCLSLLTNISRLSKDDNGRSDEDNFMTFGQVPPIIFTVFTGIEVLVALKGE